MLLSKNLNTTISDLTQKSLTTRKQISIAKDFPYNATFYPQTQHNLFVPKKHFFLNDKKKQ